MGQTGQLQASVSKDEEGAFSHCPDQACGPGAECRETSGLGGPASFRRKRKETCCVQSEVFVCLFVF